VNRTLNHDFQETMVDIYSTGGAHRRKRGGLRRKAIALVAAGAVLVCAIGAGIYFYMEKQRQSSLLNGGTFYEGISVAAVDLGGKTMAEAKAALKQKEPSLREPCSIAVTCSGKSWKVTEDDLDFHFDTDKVLNEAYAYARTGAEKERLSMIEALKKSPKNYPLSSTVTYETLEKKLAKIASEITVKPVDATVVSFDPATASFRYQDGKNGVSVDTAAFYKQVESLASGAKTGTVEVPVKSVPFGVSEAHLRSHMQKLGTFQTVSTNTADGNHNMKLAAAAVNGAVVKPGAEFSFNGTTGNTNLPENGYRKAVAISGGKKVMEYGGGVCQVSTTVYGAAIRSNMEITSRANHMWQSSYAPIGLDATVSYPSLDFKFKNPTDYPVYILAGMSGTKVTVTFYGYHSADYDTIEATSKQTGTVAQPADEYVVDQSLAKGEKKLDRKGNPGKRAEAARIFYKNGKAVRTESLPSSYYRAVATVYKVGPGTETGKAASGSSSSGAAA